MTIDVNDGTVNGVLNRIAFPSTAFPVNTQRIPDIVRNSKAIDTGGQIECTVTSY